MKKLSFCITGKNRFHQISETLPVNLRHNSANADVIEFILVDFGSTDGLQEWVTSNFNQELESGFLKYFYTDALPNWHACIAKNTAHIQAAGEILVNLDGDNFTGESGGMFTIQQFENFGKNLLLHQYSGHILDGSFGRIGLHRDHFFAVGGYDETFLHLGYEDIDLMERLKVYGLTYQQSALKEYTKAIFNTKEEGIKNTNSNLTFKEMHEVNIALSKKNLAEGKIVANESKSIGIRKDIYRYQNNELIPLTLIQQPA